MMIIQPARFGSLDPHFSSVKLLIHFDGPDASTVFTDVTGRAVTTIGTVEVDSAQAKFATSGFFGTSDDLLTVPDSDDWRLGSGEFTVECFVRLNGGVTDQAFVGHWGLGASNQAWFLYIEGGALKFRCYQGATLRDMTYTYTFVTAVWYHVAVDRDSAGKTRLYLDGVKVAESTLQNGIMPDVGFASLSIGSIGDSSSFPGYNFHGWMDELRITVGKGRYVTDTSFTVPTTAFPNS